MCMRSDVGVLMMDRKKAWGWLRKGSPRDRGSSPSGFRQRAAGVLSWGEGGQQSSRRLEV